MKALKTNSNFAKYNTSNQRTTADKSLVPLQHKGQLVTNQKLNVLGGRSYDVSSFNHTQSDNRSQRASGDDTKKMTNYQLTNLHDITITNNNYSQNSKSTLLHSKQLTFRQQYKIYERKKENIFEMKNRRTNNNSQDLEFSGRK